MQERNEISLELSTLSELVSGIGRKTPYGVPAGYFDQLPDLVMSRVTSDSMILPAAGTILSPGGSTFRVPEGYFDGFASSVLSRIKAGASTPMSSMGEGVEEELARLSVVVSGISRKTPYALPDGYFEEQSPILTVANDRSTYQAPAGYFAGLPERILEKVIEPALAGKVIRMDSPAANSREERRNESGKVLKGSWWKYSAAASIAACLLLIFSWPSVDTRTNNGSVVIETTHGLEKLSDQEILAYLDDQHDALNVSAVNSTAALDPGAASLDINEGDVKSLLGEVSDNDLQQYMEEHGKADDLATN
jgi:hypothetical protein